MNQDEYGTILNGPETYQAIALALVTTKLALIPWTDEAGTQLDILLAHGVEFAPSRSLIQGGVRPTDFFVSIMRKGAFGFELNDLETHSGYYAEKLKLSGEETIDKLAEFLNGVKAALKAEIEKS